MGALAGGEEMGLGNSHRLPSSGKAGVGVGGGENPLLGQDSYTPCEKGCFSLSPEGDSCSLSDRINQKQKASEL